MTHFAQNSPHSLYGIMHWDNSAAFEAFLALSDSNDALQIHKEIRIHDAFL